jgi:16S rRNA (cytidine1402-2'-O)-methyltransferase
VLVGTPIGNLGDLSPRAVEALASADVLCCEDTRHTRKLLSHAGLHPTRVVSLHDHNEAAQAGQVLKWLDDGQTVALVSDAGMPGVADPGERVVATAAAAGHRVEVVPGPSAVVAALVVSGLPTGRFVFEGFLPRKGSDRAERLAAVADERRTVVLFESPHRLAATLADLADACGALRAVAVVREVTKLHEEVWRGSLGAAVERSALVEPRGEHVVVLAGAAAARPASDAEIGEALAAAVAGGASRRDAVAEVADALGVGKRRVYRLALK